MFTQQNAFSSTRYYGYESVLCVFVCLFVLHEKLRNQHNLKKANEREINLNRKGKICTEGYFTNGTCLDLLLGEEGLGMILVLDSL